MKEQKDYTQDIVEIRSMMERSTKFPSLSGWAGIFAGLYALAGAYIAYYIVDFRPERSLTVVLDPAVIRDVIIVAITVLILAVATAVFLAGKKVSQKGEKMWNAASRRLLENLAVPLIAGGTLILILLSRNVVGLAAPLTLVFYGIALYGGSKFTEDEIKALGLIQLSLGLISSFYPEYGMLFWAVGFGVVHILYGIYMHFKYDR